MTTLRSTIRLIKLRHLRRNVSKPSSLTEQPHACEIHRHHDQRSFIVRHASQELRIGLRARHRLTALVEAGAIGYIMPVAAVAKAQLRRSGAAVRFQQRGDDVPLLFKRVARVAVQVFDCGLSSRGL